MNEKGHNHEAYIGLSTLVDQHWIDTQHGSQGEKIYKLFDQETNGEIIKESMQEWLCDNRTEITRCISITLQNHEMMYAEWFKFVDDKSGPDELALYSLSRKYGIHTAVYNKSYVWTTLSEHIHRTDEEIFALCGVNLVFLSRTVYNIIKTIHTSQPLSAPAHQSTSDRHTGKPGKVTCRNGNCGRKTSVPNRSRGRGKGRGKPACTLSASREANYGIPSASNAPRSSKRNRAAVDYFTLNDGLDEETPPSPKKKRRPSYRPKSGPSASPVAAQKVLSSPESKQVAGEKSSAALSIIPAITDTTLAGDNQQAQEHPTLTGVQGSEVTQPSQQTPLTGVPITESASRCGDNVLPNLVVNQTETQTEMNIPHRVTTSAVDDFEAASTLLSLHDKIRDDTLEEDNEDNTLLIPIGGSGATPIDVAPQPLLLDQVNVDAAIGNLIQNEELEQIDTIPKGVISNEQKELNEPLLEEPSNSGHKKSNGAIKSTEPTTPVVKGMLKTTTYGLKKKPDKNQTFRCTQCEAVKSFVQRLNTHYCCHHPPQMCGIWGCTFDLASSLTRHMYNHQELLHKCNRCEESFHFESELSAHKIKHQKKGSHQCMKPKCGKWFKRKWELTLHLQIHSKTYQEGCNFWAKTKKQLKEHQKSHNDDHTHICKLCGKGFKYRSGLKRHRDNDHQDS